MGAAITHTTTEPALPPELLPQVQQAYSDTFDNVMYLATASASAAFLVAMCMGWVRMKTATPAAK
jgi:hypothetical protein